MRENKRPLRVLSLDGGGMRGTYAATYLDRLASGFALRRGIAGIDIGAAFDLIVGTSTGGIIGCALAAGLQLNEVIELYRKHGRAIFRRPLPERAGLGLAIDLLRRPRALACGTEALRSALTARFDQETLGELFQRRGIAVAIAAVELGHHRSWVFKTPHLPNTNHRDDKYRLVDVCLATTAAPVYRSLAAIDHPGGLQGSSGRDVFADGGLWANNPVLVGLVDALEMTDSDRAVEIFCLGTCPRPAGEPADRIDLNRGLAQWKFGGDAASLAIDAQEFAYDHIARLLAKHLNRKCDIVRFPREQIPAALMEFLGLDDTRPEAVAALINQARTDANMANSHCGDLANPQGQLMARLFMEAPPRPP
ncbi:MAG: patatin-like phospholipase family protein [Candidatus Binatus sp.]|uniref:patatin-like phospholipase family protein n=1 Tax=Candidatus Binatus sp. TaxID=2811406 RepID=UPI002722D8EA|nr:patatin-like phospholipase family protein [Candidatus Binatus sp.]MDO8433953.1 patatin-like phospholipase family protein [Candidatus Binatus sp.]